MTQLQKTEIYSIAERKAATLLPNSRIRLTAEAESYYVFNLNGKRYIGREVNSPLPPFHSAMPELELQNHNVTTYFIQKF